MILSAVIPLLTGCRGEPPVLTAGEDTAAVVFGPSLTELFYEAGVEDRLAAVDRHSVWPPQASELPCAGDYLSPSLEAVAGMNATSIHVAGNSNNLRALADQLGIPCYNYSFDTLDDIMESADGIEELYPEADLSRYKASVLGALDSLSREHGEDSLLVMIVIYLEEDGAITLAGQNTFFADIIQGAGCRLAAPDAGSYPAISAEGVISMEPDRVLILAPGSDPGRVINVWTSGGLSDRGVSVLNGEHILIPGARLPLTIREIGACLN